MTDDLAASYAYCQQQARRAASNFYYCFHLLPRDKRRAMHALYAYLRKTDDLCDGESALPQRQAALVVWRSEVEAALAGEAQGPILPALADTAHRFEIPQAYLLDVLDGVQMDLDGRSYATFAELEHYCYRVASVVGLACIHIWGFTSERAIEPAIQCGVAFQLTNILRDLDEDAQRGRIYLPQEDLERFGYQAAELRGRVCDERLRRLVRFEAARAEEFYQQATGLHGYLHPQGQRVFGAMFDTYHALLREIGHREGDIFSGRVRVSKWKKLQIALRWMGGRNGGPKLKPASLRSIEEVRTR